MTEGGPVAYRVSYSEYVRERLLELADKARQRGDGLAFTAADKYVFQIGSEEKPRWMWGDNGNGYFSFEEGKWFLYWDCY